MSAVVLSKTYNEPDICEKEILRYAGCKTVDREIADLLKTCISEARNKLIYRVCYIELSVSVTNDICDLGILKVRSRALAANLKDAEKVILFAATVGVELDRLIAKYSRISPSKALFLQAFGAERIEALCDDFCEDIGKEYGGTKPRFSPGYGDLPLEVQKDIFSVLECSKRIGLSLTDSLLMSPSKSVTAFVGISDRAAVLPSSKCAACDKKDCEYRGRV